MILDRKTSIVQFELFSGATEGSLPLACEREFGVILIVEGVTYPAQNFRSPINDEQWRNFDQRLRDCNVNHDSTGYRGAASIRSLAQQLYQSLVALNPVLREFLGRKGTPRRLVIQTTRPELHLLPWAAMIDDAGAFLAAGDLSVVQSWANFSLMPATTDNKLQLMTVLGSDTNQVTAASLEGLPPEIQLIDGGRAFAAAARVEGIDIVHIEEHGSAVSNEIGDVFATALAATFPDVEIALLWSCLSGAANSWGESPALCLHRNGAGLVLSFLAELHNLDAKSISMAFYRDCFGPAASRDPESALVRIRADKFANEFAFANWASMTVYLRSPLDLSALPLNGPRVPAAGWIDAEVEATTADAEPAGAPVPDDGQPGTVAAAAATPEAGTTSLTDLWVSLATTVSGLQPGTLNEFHGFENLPKDAIAALPVEAFKAWRGNVIRLDGIDEPLSADTLKELNVVTGNMPKTDAAERLVWFFDRIERYGSPLIVWTNAAPRHLPFLKAVDPSSTLTFLLLYGPQPSLGVAELVDLNMLEEAQAASASLPGDCGDGELSAAYFAFSRCEDPEQAVEYLRRIGSEAERLMLIGNFIMRRGAIPNPRPDWMLHHPDGKLTNLEQQHYQEDCYRRVMSDPGTEAPLRESGRAKHQLGYLLQTLGKASVAEMLYGQALADLEKCPQAQHDFRWQGAMGCLMRDWADLLSRVPERLDEASKLLRRAMAIHSFHGYKLQIAYTLDSSARIAVTGGRFSAAIDNAMDSANLFEECRNWRGWGEAMKILFDCLAETRETARMLSVADLAMDKIQGSNLPQDQRDRLRHAFIFEKANANWIAGKLAEARSELEKLGCSATPEGFKSDIDPEFEDEVKRLFHFLMISPRRSLSLAEDRPCPN